MNEASFFEELGIPAPDVNLGCGGGTQAEQTAAIMVAFEKELMAHPTDVVLVVGDVTSTMACSIVAKKLNTKVCHVEAGIRSWDLTMPEEINRMVTDSLADYMFTTSEVANRNLVRLGATLMSERMNELTNERSQQRVWFVGNVMIDTLMANRARFRKPQVWDELGLLEFNYLVERAKAVVTDSGGITEETTVMGVPCITLRDNTERPETCTVGTNELIGTDPKAIKPALDKLFAGEWKKGAIPELWDGHTAARIVEILAGLGDRTA